MHPKLKFKCAQYKHTLVVVYLNYLKDGSLEQLVAHPTTGVGPGEGGDGKGVSHLLVLRGVEIFSVMTETLKIAGPLN